MVRFGIGYDVHKFTTRRKLILGNVEIDYPLGLEGHSDADVLIHAIMDAMLGAAALGDIGQHFPDTDTKLKNIDSGQLLEYVKIMLDKQSYRISNIDSVIVAQQPKMAPYITQMRERIAEILGIDFDLVSIKATTEEGLGVTGSEQGIAAYAVVGLER
ncbi:MAG: 2-C-methyl-D-erythritol 2,4-cyclodiphosphate synthase [Selenomonadaceae bacterium]|nr:2-C-methyl-D-erythritol 2,4-cyclodiphosphate synthase [Selenomonadaceae bacterium]